MTDGEVWTQLRRLREWAQEQIRGEGTPPWAWYQYVKLMETIDAIVAGRESVIRTESLLPEGARSETHLRLVAANGQPNIVQPDQRDPEPLLPM